jgi:2-polyprenyl-3-methyl-5-hydroxy-6-metoxy-1,4-benzoquinol methylase
VRAIAVATSGPAPRDIPRCRSCGGGKAAWRGSKIGKHLRRAFDYWHCPDCDYLFVDPFPGYGIYDEAYYQGKSADPYVDYEAEFLDYRSTARMLEFDDLWSVASGYIRKAVPPGPVKWLDFGSGPGGLLRYLADRGPLTSAGRAWSLDVSGHDIGYYADRLRGQGRFRILGPEALAAEPDARYDVISMIEVIEHVEFPDPVIALASRLLRPGGLLLLTTGNMASPVARLQGLDYAYCVPEIHVGLFTPRALEVIYARHGLDPIVFRYRGAVRFKVIKTVRNPVLKAVAGWALRLPLAVRVVDALFGTSRMPSAVRRRPVPG